MAQQVNFEIESDPLLPCPFCGGKAKIEQVGRNGLEIKCESCLMGLHQKVFRNSLEWLRLRLIESWNERTKSNN